MWRFSIATTEVQIIEGYGTWAVAAVSLCGAVAVHALEDVVLASRDPP